VVFEGKNYDPALLNTLPWLDGVKLIHAGDGFTPIDGMDTVADLLATAHNQAEHLYQTFLVISLARLASDGELVVRSKDIPEITFNTRDDFFRQLARLDYVLDLARAQPDKPLKSIDLANGLQVPVTIDTVARLQNSASAPAPGNGLFPLPRLTHIAQRDF
jgi:cell division protein FtsQ